MSTGAHRHPIHIDTHRLRARPASSAGMLSAWSDQATVRHAFGFEAALAWAQRQEGVIPPEAADAIGKAVDRVLGELARSSDGDATIAVLAEEAALAGTLAIPLVGHLREVVGGEAARWVHHGATSQDLADTALMAQAHEGRRLLLHHLKRITAALAPLARSYAETPAIGRTLLQDALPIGFGLRIAQWQAGIADAAQRLEAEPLPVQLGGASGTLAGMNGRGHQVMLRLAGQMMLAPAPPWHARRAATAALAAALGLVIGAVGKMARDVALLAQNGVSEAREPAVPGRGGSSAMAHKRNPTGCQVALSAAVRAPGLVAAVLAGMPAEEERGLGGWQAEAPVIAELFCLAGGAVEAMAVVAEGLEVDTDRIAANLAAARLGNDIGESAAIVRALLGD